MRLKKIESGHSLPARLKLGFMRVMMGMRLKRVVRVPDVIRTLLYRPGFFGTHFSALTHTVMRESRHWSAGECELFAAFVSRKNQCRF
ncbi:MAG TPA: hypothetical protein VIC71_03855 [Gammaproteobacteria bacterium]|jgi:hypothetical protein